MMTNETNEVLSPQERKIWLGVLIPEFIMIVIINAFTIFAFARKHHLRKRTTYLIINLTVADLLVGAVTGPLEIKYDYQVEPRQVFSWLKFCICMLFSVSSLLNLSLISLERLHATLYPFRHCLIEKWVYYKIIVCCWLMLLILAASGAVLSLYEPVGYPYALASFKWMSLPS